jgi:hypothetical protein
MSSVVVVRLGWERFLYLLGTLWAEALELRNRCLFWIPIRGAVDAARDYVEVNFCSLVRGLARVGFAPFL